MFHYFARLDPARKVLWCYLLWWAHTTVRHFDPSPRLWLTSAGLSAVIGFALVLSVRTSANGRTKLDRWQIFRLFLMPFCVSSFAALVKGLGFVLIFPPTLSENLSALGVLGAFLVITSILKKTIPGPGRG